MSYFDAFNATEAARIPGLILTNNAVQNRLNAERQASMEAKAHQREMDKLRSEREALTLSEKEEAIRRRDLKIAELESKLDTLAQQEAKWKEAVQRRDSIILDWMHLNEGYKRLATKYGKKLGVSDEQIIQDSAVQCLEAVQENPTFSNTTVSKTSQKILGKK